MPDLNGNSVGEVTLLSDESVPEIPDGGTGALSVSLAALSAKTRPVVVTQILGSDPNVVAEVAVLAARQNDGRAVVRIRSPTGAPAVRPIWFASGHTDLVLRAMGDADGSSVPDVAVLAKRDIDGRIVVQVKNAAGDANSRLLRYSSGQTAQYLAILE